METNRKVMDSSKEYQVVEFEQIIERGCGLDVHEKMVVATINGIGLKLETRTFDTFTSSLQELADWLSSHRITHVAMESTGVYWKPIFNILEENFHIILVNARHLKSVPGRKTDKIDSQWICKLLLSGLLKASYVPQEKIRQLRDLSRYSTKLIQQSASEKNRIQKILEDANIKLSSVVSSISGMVSTKLIDALIEGEADLEKFINSIYTKKLKATKADLLKAVTGRVTDHHRFMLRKIKKHIAFLEQEIADLEAQMDEILTDNKSVIELLSTIPGVDKKAATNIVAEIGVDVEAFPSEKHLAKWAGICPGNNESGGKKKALEPPMATNI
ncbi:IS110 family transposase [Dyadobacter sp. CY312]|uniref:IS110 family transposase n=1 Tax=Dyadobacter sp. CY312 TaxID=2907303 RepID=UPI001F391B05|nr:IS110 family transposase [Dyadobacter sp. CY312]MCE7039584.1 IS110 family transposase [Dyadobacter sp. CY312]